MFFYVWCQGRNVVVFFKQTQFLNVHFHLVVLAHLVVLLLVDIGIGSGIGLCLNQEYHSCALGAAHLGELRHHEIVGGGVAQRVGAVHLVYGLAHALLLKGVRLESLAFFLGLSLILGILVVVVVFIQVERNRAQFRLAVPVDVPELADAVGNDESACAVVGEREPSLITRLEQPLVIRLLRQLAELVVGTAEAVDEETQEAT